MTISFSLTPHLSVCLSLYPSIHLSNSLTPTSTYTHTHTHKHAHTRCTSALLLHHAPATPTDCSISPSVSPRLPAVARDTVGGTWTKQMGGAWVLFIALSVYPTCDTYRHNSLSPTQPACSTEVRASGCPPSAPSTSLWWRCFYCSARTPRPSITALSLSVRRSTAGEGEDGQITGCSQMGPMVALQQSYSLIIVNLNMHIYWPLEPKVMKLFPHFGLMMNTFALITYDRWILQL